MSSSHASDDWILEAQSRVRNSVIRRLRNFQPSHSQKIDENLVDDIVQDALCRALENTQHLPSEERIRWWTIRAAINLVVDHHRQQQIAKRHNRDAMLRSQRLQSNPSNHLLLDWLRREGLRSLEPYWRMMFRLRFEEDWTIGELAELDAILQLSTETLSASARMQRFRRRFLQEMDRLEEIIANKKDEFESCAEIFLTYQESFYIQRYEREDEA